jgi:MFS family permease
MRTLPLLEKLPGSPAAALVVVTAAFFTDSFLYGMLVPLAPHSPAGIGNEGALAVMYGGYALGMMAATPLLGVLSDRLGRRRPLLWGVLGQTAATVLLAVATTFVQMMLARIVQGVAAAATWTAGLALIAETFPLKRTQMMGLVMMGSNGGSILGPVAGGFLLEWGGYQLPFAAAGGLLLLDGLMRLTLLVDPKRQVGDSPSLVGFFGDRSVLVAALVVVLGVAGWGLLEPLFPSHLHRVAGTSPGMVGLMFTVATLFYGLSAPLVERAVERWGLRPTMAVGLGLMALSLPLLALPTSPLMAGAALTLTSVLYAFALNPTFTELAEAVDRRGTGGYASVYAIYNIAYSIGMLASNVLAGALISQVSFLSALLLTSLVMLAAVPWLAFAPYPGHPGTDPARLSSSPTNPPGDKS